MQYVAHDFSGRFTAGGGGGLSVKSLHVLTGNKYVQ